MKWIAVYLLLTIIVLTIVAPVEGQVTFSRDWTPAGKRGMDCGFVKTKLLRDIAVLLQMEANSLKSCGLPVMEPFHDNK
uniref:Uncharacterized protein n=1 Tax=Strigamia maritima TaxID=126957 RepID=T1JNZ1_STRMM